MGDFPRGYTPRVVHTWTKHFPLNRAPAHGLSPAPTSATWATADRALYIPFTLPFDYPVRRVFWANGSSLTGNGCLALLNDTGRHIYTTGGRTRTPASSIQWVGVDEPFWLAADAPYYLGLAFGTTTDAMFGTTAVTVPIGRMLGLLGQTAANPIPDPATFSALAHAGYPLAGFSRVP